MSAEKGSIEKIEIVEISHAKDCEPLFEVMSQLRPHLDRGAFREGVSRLIGDGARILAARTGGNWVGCTIFRHQFRLARGWIVYVEDLVVSSSARSLGVGAALLDEVEAAAVALGVAYCQLDSGVHRPGAHKFYFRQGYEVCAFNFLKQVARDESA